MQQVALTKILAMRCAFALLFLIFSPIYAFPQQSVLPVQLNWGNERISVSPGPEATQNILYFEGAVNDPGYYHLPFYTLQIPVDPGRHFRVRVGERVFSPLNHEELIPRQAAIGKDLHPAYRIHSLAGSLPCKKVGQLQEQFGAGHRSLV